MFLDLTSYVLLIAGMTSVGGGAVAFPILTLVLHVHASIARDVALMIQSSGMTAASFSIFFMGVCVEWHALILCTVGSLAGIVFGLHVIDPLMSPASKKLSFVSIWLSFAFVLVMLNRTHKRRTFNTIPEFNWWKGLILVVGGFIGGIFTAFAGTGLDICAFMVLTLLFRISEKTATPTTVILMAFNSVIALYWRANMIKDVTDEAWQYISICFPIVTLMAPLGSLLGTHFHRLVLAVLVIVLNIIAFILAFIIVRPLTPILIGTSVGLLVGCFLVFVLMMYIGGRILTSIETREGALSQRKVSVRYDDRGNITDLTRYSVLITDGAKSNYTGIHDNRPINQASSANLARIADNNDGISNKGFIHDAENGNVSRL